jgi:ribosomal protein L30E
MTLNSVQKRNFRKFLMASLDQHVQNEINYYLENVAEYHFRGSDVDSGVVREQLLDDAALLTISFES